MKYMEEKDKKKRCRKTQPRVAVPQDDVQHAKPVKWEYCRDLPHIQQEGKTIFITFATWKRWKLPESVRSLVIQHCLHDNNVKAIIHGVVVMPDHVHVVLSPLTDAEGNSYGLAEIMNSIKGASAHSINKALKREGRVWQDESFDHILRSNESAHGTVEYVCQNPEVKGLSKSGAEYPWLWREWVEGVAQPPSAGKGDEE
jgi:REP element-mobilizing transposase RayT